MTEADIELLRHIAEVEDGISPDTLPGKLGWTWREAQVWPVVISRLLIKGWVEDVYVSNSYHGYRLTAQARGLLARALPEDPDFSQKKQELPDVLFQDIIGHEDVKELLGAALSAERPVHVLLAGPPALAKTLFLWELERVGGEQALWLLGSATSKAGLWDVVAERQPRWLLIDELDKMSAADTAGLLSLMEGGRLVRAKVGREMSRAVPLWVVAATNHLERLSPELRSRFAVRKLHPYGRDEFREVVKGVLTRREGVSPEVAAEIAERLDGRSQDVRDGVRVARLAPQLGVERAVRLLLGEA